MHDDGRPIAAAQRHETGGGAGTTVLDDPSTFACASDPDRWTTVPDEGAKALCRACPHRWRCAREACRTPGAEGLWAGVLIPEAGRGRKFALKQLRSLADRDCSPIRARP